MPSDSGAIVLYRESPAFEVFWAERAPGSAFLPGYRAFVGGRVEPQDEELARRLGRDGIAALAELSAIRELFEETGVLLAAGPGRLDPARRETAREALLGGRPFAAVLDDLGVTLGSTPLRTAGRWVTPPFAPRRFDTHFFLAPLPPGQEPRVRSAELASGEWIEPRTALAAWERGHVLLAPPILHLVRALAPGLDDGLDRRLVAVPAARGALIETLEFVPGVILVPLRTETLPPATHTNAYILAGDRLAVVDPAAADPAEREKLHAAVERLCVGGRALDTILLTHHHHDHVDGTEALRERLGGSVAAHALTAERLRGRVRVDRILEDGAAVDLGGGHRVLAIATPGHTRGHLAFYDERRRALVAGDNVVGIGTVLIDPPEGDMDEYLASLARLREVETPGLFGGHGPPLVQPQRAIDRLVRHRHDRETAIVAALRSGAARLEEIVHRAYTDVPEKLHVYARRQALAHLQRLERRGQVETREGGYALR